MPARSIGATARALAALTVLLFVYAWPLSAFPWRESLNWNADAELNTWIVSWVAHMLPAHPTQLFDGNIFAPEPDMLTYSDPLIAPSADRRAVAVDRRAARVRRSTSSRSAGCISPRSRAGGWRGDGRRREIAAIATGSLVAFNVHTLSRLPHLAATHAWGVPLALGVALAMAERPSWTRGLALAAIVTATAATSAYLLAMVGVIVCGVAIASVPRWRAIGALAASSGAGLVAALPVLWPYVRLARSGASRPLEVVRAFSATPSGYFVTRSLVDRWWSAPLFDRNDVNMMFAGVTALAFAAIGVGALWRTAGTRRRAIAIVVIAAMAVLLSFGPQTAIYAWLYRWLTPLTGLRAVARFGYVYLVCVAFAAGIGIDALMRRARSPRAAGAIGAIALGLITMETWPGPALTVPLQPVPPIYSLLADDPQPVMLVEVPFYPANAVFQNGDYVYNATGHWRPLMNGYSGMTPMSVPHARRDVLVFPRRARVRRDETRRRHAHHGEPRALRRRRAPCRARARRAHGPPAARDGSRRPAAVCVAEVNGVSERARARDRPARRAWRGNAPPRPGSRRTRRSGLRCASCDTDTRKSTRRCGVTPRPGAGWRRGPNGRYTAGPPASFD